MKISTDNVNKEKLISLWQNVFGDDRDYIELLLSESESFSDIFAVTVSDEICSVLYLLDCELSLDGICYKGKYLYAAATAEKHRKKGFMAKLITEAQEYCSDNGYDFISLVPANEPLYSYYEKFGFEPRMHIFRNICFNIRADANEISAEEYFKERSQRLNNCFNFTNGSVGYAALCLEYSGYRFYKDGDNNIYLSEGDAFKPEEVISSDGNIIGASAEKYGMVYPINNSLNDILKRTSVYMNLALD